MKPKQLQSLVEAGVDMNTLVCGGDHEDEEVDVCSVEDQDEINSSFESTNSLEGKVPQQPKTFSPFSIDYLLR